MPLSPWPYGTKVQQILKPEVIGTIREPIMPDNASILTRVFNEDTRQYIGAYFNKDIAKIWKVYEEDLEPED